MVSLTVFISVMSMTDFKKKLKDQRKLYFFEEGGGLLLQGNIA